MPLSKLFKVFLRLGATGFGGMVALLAIVQEQVVERRKMVSPQAFAEGMAIGQILPGPIVVDLVTHLGYRLRGLTGAIVSTIALILPAFLLMLILTPLHLAYGDMPRLEGAFKGIAAAVVAVIIAATYRIGRSSVKNLGGVCFAAIACIALAQLKVSPVLIILAAGLVGMILWRPSQEAKGDE